MITGMFAAPARPRSALRTKRTASTATRTTERHHTLLAEYTAFSRPPPRRYAERHGGGRTRCRCETTAMNCNFLALGAKNLMGISCQNIMRHSVYSRTLSPNTGHTPETGRVTSIKTEFDAFTRTAHRGLIGKTSLQVCATTL